MLQITELVEKKKSWSYLIKEDFEGVANGILGKANRDVSIKNFSVGKDLNSLSFSEEKNDSEVIWCHIN